MSDDSDDGLPIQNLKSYRSLKSSSTFGAGAKQLALEEDVFYRADDTDDADLDLVGKSHQCGQALVFKQDHTMTTVWSLITLVALLYVGTIFIYRFAFVTFHLGPDGVSPLDKNALGWDVVNYTVDGFFCVDLFFSFFLSYEDAQGVEVTDIRVIAIRYLLGPFWLNLLACLPHQALDAIIHGVQSQDDRVDPSVARLYRLQRLFRLARLAHLTRSSKLAYLKLIPGWDVFRSVRVCRVVLSILTLLFTCHLLACGWYLTAVMHENPAITWVGRFTIVNIDGDESTTLLSKRPEEQWVVAMYFILTVFTTVGFGDISAHTEIEIAYVVFTMIVGAVVHSIILSEVIQLVTATDRTNEFIQNQMRLFNAFANHTEFDLALFRDIQKDLRECAKRSVLQKSTYDKDEMEQLLMSKYMPRSVINRLPDGLFGGQLSKSSFLRCCYEEYMVPPRLASLLAIHLQPAEYSCSELAYQLHDFAFYIGLVIQGTFAYVAQPSPEGGKEGMLRVHPSDELVDQEGSHRSHLGVSPWWSGRPSNQDTVNAEQLLQRKQSQHLYPYQLVGHNNYFGDAECMSGTLRFSTVRCERSGTALLLRKRDLDELVLKFPQCGQVWAAAAWQRELTRIRARKKLTEAKSCRTFAAITIQHHFRAWKNTPDRPRKKKGDAQQFAKTVTTKCTQKLIRAPSSDTSLNVTDRSDRSTPPPRKDATDNSEVPLPLARTKHELMQLTSPQYAHSSLSQEVQDLRKTVANMHNEYRSDMKECRDDMKVIKDALSELMRCKVDQGVFQL